MPMPALAPGLRPPPGGGGGEELGVTVGVPVPVLDTELVCEEEPDGVLVLVPVLVSVPG